jgi:5-methylcytosine-specific restriction protein A
MEANKALMSRRHLNIQSYTAKETCSKVKNGVNAQNKREFQKMLNKAGYRCEVDGEHPTFEGVTLYPELSLNLIALYLSRRDDFNTSLDVEENIISLCCNCHKQIHLETGI